MVVNPGMPIPVGHSPTAIALTSDATLALVTNTGDSTVSVINTGLLQAVATIPTEIPGSAPIGIAIQNAATFQPGAGTAPLAGASGSFKVGGAFASLAGSVVWDFFGNGTVVQTTSTLSTSHAYAAPGTYSARVTVLTKSGGTLLTKTVPVHVQSPLQALRTAAVLVKLAHSLPSSLQSSLQIELNLAYVYLEGGHTTSAYNEIALYVSQLSSLLLRPPAVAAALSEGEAIKAALAQATPVLGTGQLAPQGGSSAVGQPVTVQVGPYKATIPAGSFHQLASGPYATVWAFSGTIGTVSLAVDILSFGHNSYQFGAAAEPVDLTAVADPVPVLFSIGNNEGSTTVNARRLP